MKVGTPFRNDTDAHAFAFSILRDPWAVNFPRRSISIVGRDTGLLHAQNITPLVVCVGMWIPGKPVDESFDGEVLQEFIERTGRFPGFAEKAMMHRCGYVLDAFSITEAPRDRGG